MEERIPTNKTDGDDFMAWLMLSGLVLASYIGNGLWVNLDTRPPHWDASAHLRIALSYLAVLASPEGRWVDLLSVESYYPPFFHLSLVPFLVGFGAYADSAVWLNGFYLAVIIVSTFAIGQTIFDRATGLTAALLIACYPYLVYVSRTCMIDTALTAFVSLCYYCFLRSKNFEDAWFTFLFSFLFAWGMLVKWTFIFFMAPALLTGFFSNGDSGWRHASLRVRWTNFIMILGIPVLICFPWYAHNLAKMVKAAPKFAGAGTMEGDPTQGWDLWLYYFRAGESQMGLGFFLVFLGAGFFFLTRKNFFNRTLFFWIVVPYLVFTWINNKDIRYTLPYLPAVAVISARAIFLFRKTVVRNLLLGLIAVVSVVNYGWGGFSNHAWKSLPLPVLGEVPFVKGLPPIKKSWPIERVLKDMIEEAGAGKDRTITVRTLTNHKSFHRGAFREMVQANDFPVEMKIVKRDLGELTDFFITKYTHAGPEGSRPGELRNRLKNDPALTQTFPEFRRYSLPDGSQGVVYGRKVRPANGLEGVNDLMLIEKRLGLAFTKYPRYGISQGENYKIKILPTNNPEDLYLGKYKRITVTADTGVIDKIRFHNLYLSLEDVQINLYELLLYDKLVFFKIGRLLPKLTLRFEDVEKRVAAKMKNKLKRPLRLEGKGGAILASLKLDQPAVPILAQARLVFKPGEFIRPVVDFIRVGPVTLPDIFYRVFLTRRMSLNPTSGWPLATDIRSIDIFPRQVVVNASYLPPNTP